MRSHRAIVQAYGASNLHRDLTGLGVEIAKSTPQRWAERDSVPGEYWALMAQLGAATVEELAEAAATKVQPPQEAA
jgi:hypothetical protein